MVRWRAPGRCSPCPPVSRTRASTYPVGLPSPVLARQRPDRPRDGCARACAAVHCASQTAQGRAAVAAGQIGRAKPVRAARAGACCGRGCTACGRVGGRWRMGSHGWLTPPSLPCWPPCCLWCPCWCTFWWRAGGSVQVPLRTGAPPPVRAGPPAGTPCLAQKAHEHGVLGDRQGGGGGALRGAGGIVGWYPHTTTDQIFFRFLRSCPHTLRTSCAGPPHQPPQPHQPAAACSCVAPGCASSPPELQPAGYRHPRSMEAA